MPLRITYLKIIFVLSFAGSFLTIIKVGGISASSIFTFSAILIPFFLLKLNIDKSIIKVSFPFILYVLYDFSSLFWGPITKSIIQDFAVWTGMLLLFFISSISVNNLYERIVNIIEMFKYPFILLLTFFFIIKLDSPATMMISLIFFCFYFAKLVSKQVKIIDIYIIIFLVIVPIITGSRIIYASELVIIFFSLLFFYGDKKSLKDKLKKILILVFSFFILAFIGFIFQDKINDVMKGGDNTQVAGVSINTSGRSFMWEMVINSAKKNIIFGQGTDGPAKMLNTPRWGHPHNDYLRLLHHNGIIGLSLWLLFFLSLFIFLYKRIKKTLNIEYKTYYIFNFIFLLSVMIIMITDNPIVYSYVMYPLMIISGISLSLFQREKLNIYKF